MEQMEIRWSLALSSVTNAKMVRDPFLIILLMVRSKPSTSFLFHVYYCLIWTGNTNMILIFSIRPKHYVLSEGYYFCPKKKWGGTIIQLIWIICFQNIKLWDTSKSNIRTRKLLIYYGGEMSHVFYIRLFNDNQHYHYHFVVVHLEMDKILFHILTCCEVKVQGFFYVSCLSKWPFLCVLAFTLSN
jgi:hypothetical protein